jgi:peptide/nickel transport system substrate-binding protein
MTFNFKLCAVAMTAAAAFAAPVIAQEQSVFSAAYGQGFIDIDPSSANSNEIALIANVYEALVRYVPGVDGADATIEPSLATSWSVSDDQLTWTFKLREGVTFHDGTPFTSEAVKYSIERTQALDAGSAWIWWMVTLEQPIAFFCACLCFSDSL